MLEVETCKYIVAGIKVKGTAAMASMARGGTDLERGYGDVRPWRPPFNASPAVHKGGSHFSLPSFTRVPFQPIVSSQAFLLRKKIEIYLNFCPNFRSQASKFGNFKFTSPQIWKFSIHKPPNLEIFHSQAPSFRGNDPFTSPPFRKCGPHTPTKKSWVPPLRLNGLGIIWALNMVLEDWKWPSWVEVVQVGFIGRR